MLRIMHITIMVFMLAATALSADIRLTLGAEAYSELSDNAGWLFSVETDLSKEPGISPEFFISNLHNDEVSALTLGWGFDLYQSKSHALRWNALGLQGVSLADDSELLTNPQQTDRKFGATTGLSYQYKSEEGITAFRFDAMIGRLMRANASFNLLAPFRIKEAELSIGYSKIKVLKNLSPNIDPKKNEFHGPSMLFSYTF